MASHLIYQPEGTETRRRFTMDPDEMSSLTLEAIEDATGWTAVEWLDRASRGSVKAIHALLWVMLRETTPDLDYDAVVFKMSEIDFEDAEPDSDPKEPASDSDASGTGG